MPPWDCLIRQHQRRVIVSLLGLGLGLDRARDVAQTAWAHVMEKHQRGELAELQMPGLVIAQARFIAIDELRRERRQGQILVPLGSHEGLSGDDPAALCVQRERASRVLAALSELSPTVQQVFRFVCRDGLNCDEAARMLGLSTQRVRQILCEARKRLRVALEEESI